MDLSISTVLRWGQKSQDKPFWRTSQATRQRLSWRCQYIIPTLGVRSNTRPQLGKAGQEHSHSSKAQHRLGLDHGAWNEMQINQKTACYCLTSQICKGNHKNVHRQLSPRLTKLPVAREITRCQLCSGARTREGKQCWAVHEEKHFWADFYRSVRVTGCETQT